ncbi:MAG: hypothetical protein WA190_00050 [Usitatibacter sp.]
MALAACEAGAESIPTEKWVRITSFHEVETTTLGRTATGVRAWTRQTQLDDYAEMAVLEDFDCTGRQITQRVARYEKRDGTSGTKTFKEPIIIYPAPSTLDAMRLALMCGDFAKRYAPEKEKK